MQDALIDQAYRGQVVPVAKRWVVERTFAWLASFRRLSYDFERTPASHEAWLLVANLTMTLRRATVT